MKKPRGRDRDLFTEGVERAAGANVDVAICNRRSRIALVVQLIYRKHLPITGSFQDRDLATLTNQKYFVIRSNRR